MTVRTLAFIALVAGSVSCGAPSQDAPPLDGAAVDLAALPPLVAREELRIGSVDDPDVGFTVIGSVAVDDDGHIYVVEARELQLRRYGPTGELVGAMGRRGEGPGEFRSSPRIGVVGDTVWALESATRRITLFSKDGRVLSATQFQGVPVALQPVPPIQGIGAPTLTGLLVPYLMRGDGRFVSQLLDVPSAGPPGDVAPGDTILVPRLVFDAYGAVVDTVGWDVRLPPDPPSMQLARVGGLTFGVPYAPSDEPLAIPAVEGGFLVDRRVAASGEGGHFRVTRFDGAGDALYARTFRYLPTPYTTAALEEQVDVATQIAGVAIVLIGQGVYQLPLEGPNRRPSEQERNRARAAVAEAMSFPQFQVPVQGHWLGADGGLWLRREAEPEALVRWLVLDPGGTPRGEIVLPEAIRPVWARGDRFLAVERDDLGLRWLVGYRLVPGQG